MSFFKLMHSYCFSELGRLVSLKPRSSIYAYLVFLCCLCLPGKLFALELESVSLELNPQRCIALHRGQRCYQDLVFRWESTRLGHFCLFMRQGGLADKKTLKCWQKQGSAEFHYEFSGEQSSRFFLIDMETQEELANTELDLVWVYKRSKKISSGWRLF